MSRRRDRSREHLDDLGSIVPTTDEQAARMRQLVAGQPDATDLLDALGIDPTPTQPNQKETQP